MYVVTDTGGSRIFKGLLTPEVGKLSYYLANFSKNYIKMTEIGPRDCKALGLGLIFGN